MNEQPLYFYAADVQAGDAAGDGQGVWHVICGASKGSEARPRLLRRLPRAIGPTTGLLIRKPGRYG